MRELKEPVLKIVTKKSTPKRERYWLAHGGKPTRKRLKRLGFARRITRSSPLTTVVTLATLAETMRGSQAHAEAQRMFRRALEKLSRVNPFMLEIPAKLEAKRLYAAWDVQPKH